MYIIMYCIDLIRNGKPLDALKAHRSRLNNVLEIRQLMPSANVSAVLQTTRLTWSLLTVLTTRIHLLLNSILSERCHETFTVKSAYKELIGTM